MRIPFSRPSTKRRFESWWNLVGALLVVIVMTRCGRTMPGHCGDGYLNPSEQCDDANIEDGDGCSSICLLEGPAVCGDGQLDPGEQCDDGNIASGDGCGRLCEVEVLLTCGDGQLDSLEQCDDGNQVSGDGCNDQCRIEPLPGCGDTVLDEDEECDDGNVRAGDGCDGFCRLEVPGECGNSVLDPGEECEDGNTLPNDGCDETCHFEGVSPCGNGSLEDGEECDDNNRIPFDGCSPECLTESLVNCGDGTLDPGEQCDDGNMVAFDGCSPSCRVESFPDCGNGRLDDGEQCDDGNRLEGDGCSPFCRFEAAVCGNGRIEVPEECDDENNQDGDGCSADCEFEPPITCGDGVLDRTEQCDDGNLENGDGCDDTCRLEPPETCGNGVLDAGEECDDGNLEDGDGCNALCRTEACDADITLGALPLNIAVTRNLEVSTATDAASACGDGPERVIRFSLSTSADLELEILQTGDHSYGLFDDIGGVCTSGPSRCYDPRGAPRDMTTFRQMPAGNYLLIVESVTPDSAANTSVALTAVSRVPSCGDGEEDPGELCDDGNTLSGDGCSADCQSDETCGNRILDVAAGEVCDDGNQTAGDGCSTDCQSDETCGNGLLDTITGEVCDDGNNRSGDGCSIDCLSNESCGNSILDGAAGETCDDGNRMPGDGCDPSCQKEPGTCSIDEELGPITPGITLRRNLDIESASDDWSTDCGAPGPEHVLTVELTRYSDIRLVICSTGGHAIGLYRSGEVSDVCVAREGTCIGPVNDRCNTLTFGGRAPGVYHIITEANGIQNAGSVDMRLTLIGCAPDLEAGPLDPAGSNTYSYTTMGGGNEYDAGCASPNSGNEHVLAFSLPQDATLDLTWSQTGDHVFSLFRETTGACDRTPIACHDAQMAASGTTSFPRLDAGNYFLITDAFSSGTEGDVKIDLRLR